jgi:hypothetical protein
MTDRRQHSWRRAPALLVVALSLAFTASASAQTAFQASVTANTPKPKPCSNPGFCGTADIAGYGPATYTTIVTSETNVSSAPCPPPFPPGSSSAFAYTMTDTFQLLSDGSTLVVDESGLVCTPGNSQAGITPAGSFPAYASASWTVDTTQPPTGQFAGLTGSGTDAGHSAGAHLSLIYSGTLG